METVFLTLQENGVQEFKRLFDKYSKRLYDIACRHVSQADAEDIVQELFIEIWEKRKTIDIRLSWDGYLYATLKYRIFRFLDRRNELDETLAAALRETGESDEILGFETLYCLLDEAINDLSPQCRTIFGKKYYENKKLQEIADEMNISVETIKTQLKRGLKVIRLRMREALADFMFL